MAGIGACSRGAALIWRGPNGSSPPARTCAATRSASCSFGSSGSRSVAFKCGTVPGRTATRAKSGAKDVSSKRSSCATRPSTLRPDACVAGVAMCGDDGVRDRGRVCGRAPIAGFRPLCSDPRRYRQSIRELSPGLRPEQPPSPAPAARPFVYLELDRSQGDLVAVGQGQGASELGDAGRRRGAGHGCGARDGVGEDGAVGVRGHGLIARAGDLQRVAALVGDLDLDCDRSRGRIADDALGRVLGGRAVNRRSGDGLGRMGEARQAPDEAQNEGDFMVISFLWGPDAVGEDCGTRG